MMRHHGNGARGPRWLGQAPDDWFGRARRAVMDYDAALKEAATVADAEARGRILEWIGRADVPGSPAERYTAVRQDVEAGAAAFEDEPARRRVEQIEEAVSELASRVSNAIESYGALPAPERAGGATEGAGRTAMCVAGGIALLGLIVIPLLLLD